MKSIVSFCLLLCLVAATQSTFIGRRYQTTASDEVEPIRQVSSVSVPIGRGGRGYKFGKKRNDVLRYGYDSDGEEVNLTLPELIPPTPETTADKNLQTCSNVDDQQIDEFAQMTLARVNKVVESAGVIRSAIIIKRFIALVGGDREQFNELKQAHTNVDRVIMNGKMTDKIVRETMKSTEETVLSFLARNSNSEQDPTEFEKKQQLVSALVKRLEPKPCQKEFISDMLVYGDVKRRLYVDCQPEKIYNTEWYKQTCMEVIEGAESGESGNAEVCFGVPTVESSESE